MLLITGSTACGKSAVALALAAMTGGEIVCADAFQLYGGLPILTAQPGPADLTAVRHHLYGSVPPTADMDAVRFSKMAEKCVTEISRRGKLAIVTGGSGLYIKALTHGLSPLPRGDAALRAQLDALPPEELTARLLALDPDAGVTVNLTNPRYVQRALEIALLTGRPVAEQKKSFEAGPRPDINGFLLSREREELYGRINARTNEMIADGVLEEVRSLPAHLSATARKTIGLQEVQDVLTGSLRLPDAIAAIQQNTRRYAKRQGTWFRRESWLQPVDAAGRSAEDIATEILRYPGASISTGMASQT